MTLKELGIGESARIKTVGGDGALRQHFLDMGVIPKAELVRIANLSVPVSSSFDYLCSFYSCTPTPRRPSMAHTRFLTCRVGVNADLQLEIARAHTRPSL